MCPDSTFWTELEKFVRSGSIVIDRPRGSRHPKVPEYVYPLDYGYIEGSRSGDGVFCTFDPMDQAAELKVLWKVTPAETRTLVDFYEPQSQEALLVARPR